MLIEKNELIDFWFFGFFFWFFLQAILKTNAWRVEYGVDQLKTDSEIVKNNLNKARVLRHRDMHGRPVIYIPTKNHNPNERDIDELTKFIVYCLVRIVFL